VLIGAPIFFGSASGVVDRFSFQYPYIPTTQASRPVIAGEVHLQTISRYTCQALPVRAADRRPKMNGRAEGEIRAGAPAAQRHSDHHSNEHEPDLFTS
jgi:hypothetical protein